MPFTPPTARDEEIEKERERERTKRERERKRERGAPCDQSVVSSHHCTVGRLNRAVSSSQTNRRDREHMHVTGLREFFLEKLLVNMTTFLITTVCRRLGYEPLVQQQRRL